MVAAAHHTEGGQLSGLEEELETGGCQVPTGVQSNDNSVLQGEEGEGEGKRREGRVRARGGRGGAGKGREGRVRARGGRGG